MYNLTFDEYQELPDNQKYVHEAMQILENTVMHEDEDDLEEALRTAATEAVSHLIRSGYVKEESA